MIISSFFFSLLSNTRASRFLDRIITLKHGLHGVVKTQEVGDYSSFEPTKRKPSLKWTQSFLTQWRAAFWPGHLVGCWTIQFRLVVYSFPRSFLACRDLRVSAFRIPSRARPAYPYIYNFTPTEGPDKNLNTHIIMTNRKMRSSAKSCLKLERSKVSWNTLKHTA